MWISRTRKETSGSLLWYVLVNLVDVFISPLSLFTLQAGSSLHLNIIETVNVPIGTAVVLESSKWGLSVKEKPDM